MRTRRLPRTALATGLLAVLALGPALAASGAEPTPDAVENVTMLVGENETQRNFSWHSRGLSLAPESIVIAPTSDMNGNDFPASARTIEQSEGGLAVNKPGYTYHHATVDNLAPSTGYTYQVGTEDGWSEIYTFTTGPASGDAVDLVYVADPQIGTTDLEAERLQWIDTLDQAWATYPGAELLVSGGDQVDRIIADDDEYDAFHEPVQLTQYPLATTLGNHDVAHFLTYGNHFNLPHGGGRGDFNYHYTYNGTLFIHLNSNNLLHGSLIDYARAAIEQNPSQWVVVTFHHSIYSVATHATDIDAEDLGIIEGRRTALSRGMTELGVDLVLSGHDHYYTRTPLMHAGVAVGGPDADPQAGPDFLAPGEGDVLYITGTTASGSKFYGRNDELPEPAEWGEVENQENVANYSHLSIDECSITVTTHRAATSTNVTTGEAYADNSVVDEVELSGDETAPAISAPALTVTAGDPWDALTGVQVTDNCDTDAIVPEVEGVIDTTTPGDYTLTYTATDRSGNSSSVERTVTVEAAPEPEPTEEPTPEPTDEPTETPTSGPSEEPTETPTAGPSESPTAAPTSGTGGGSGDAPGGGAGYGDGSGYDEDRRGSAGSRGGAGGPRGGLADTGATTGDLVGVAAVLLLAGGALYGIRRRLA
ncbi:fibronectin type III domain-containing protein [Georgenia sp. Z1491]|uniref:fibronectin type III domain-containing protein n=1 Tax=Georgenia sp. Z1491 TaxID=3416707 RepID=UPI003CEB6166